MPATVSDIQRYLRGRLDYAVARYPGSLEDRWRMMVEAVTQVTERPDTIPSELMNVGDDIAEDIVGTDALIEQTPRGKTLCEVFAAEPQTDDQPPIMWDVFCKPSAGDDENGT